MDQLLAMSLDDSTQILLYIVLGVVGGIVLLCGIYGGIRKFTRLTWIGWELLIAFGIDLVIPTDLNFAVSLLLLIAVSALPLVGEYFLRGALVTNQVVPSKGAKNFFDHFFGIFTALFGVLAFLAALGGLGVVALDTFAPDFMRELEIPEIILAHGLDFFVIAVFMVTMRAGCRLGVMKGLNFLLTLLLVFGAFFGCFLIFSQVSWGRSFANTVGGWFGMEGMLAALVGCFTATMFFFLLCFILIMFLSKFIDRCIQKANSHAAVAIPDALIVGILYAAVFILILLGIQALIGMIANGNFLTSLAADLNIDASSFNLGGIDGNLATYGQDLARFAQSSPLSQGLYLGNPFM